MTEIACSNDLIGAPEEELARIVEAKHGIIVLNIVFIQECVDLIQLWGDGGERESVNYYKL